MDCTEPDVGAPDEPRDKSSMNSQPQDIEIGKSSINSRAEDIDDSSTNGEAGDKSSINSRAQCEPQGIDNSSTKDESQDIDKKTPVNDEAEQICHNVSVPLFTAK